MVDHEIPGRIILGSGRSGTTWVQDSLAFANQLRPIFEPLREGESEFGKQFAYHVMSPSDVDLSLQRHFMDLSQGKIHSRWIDYRGLTDELFRSPLAIMKERALQGWIWRWRKYLRDRSTLKPLIGRQRTLIKCIRANLMAGWFVQSLGFRTVLLVRHPCAVVESQLKNSVAWDPYPIIERYRRSSRLHELTGGKYLALLSSRLTRLKALTLNWVIENQCPVQFAGQERYSVFYYENLLRNPTLTWREICTALALQNMPNVDFLLKPSQQSSAEFISSDEAVPRSARWRQSLQEAQLAEVQSILDATDCGLYHVKNDLPFAA